MTQHLTIRRIVAGMMIIVFALSITPKQVLHKLFSNHEDILYNLSRDDQANSQINKSGINCQCFDIVTESPFIDTNDPINFLIPAYFTDKKASHFSRVISISKFFSEFRGPPSLLLL